MADRRLERRFWVARVTQILFDFVAGRLSVRREGAWVVPAFAGAAAVSAFVQNEPNFRPFRAESPDSRPGRTQSKPIWADSYSVGEPALSRAVRAGALSSVVQNKANFLRLWAENGGGAEKQSQSARGCGIESSGPCRSSGGRCGALTGGLLGSMLEGRSIGLFAAWGSVRRLP